MTDNQTAVRAVIERALADLTEIGMEPTNAARLLVIQGFNRLDREQQEEMRGWIDQWLHDDDNPPPPPRPDLRVVGNAA